MKLGTVLFVAYLAIFALCLTYPIAHVAGELRRAYVESAEEPLVDTANILAAMVGHTAGQNGFDAEQLYRVFDDVYSRQVAAQIYDMRKEKVDLVVYVTDAKGVVLFHSEGRDRIGQDFSRWRDVSRTLSGVYGARIKRNPDDPKAPAVLFVAAPILADNKIAGVLTVAKPTSAISAFVHTARPRIFQIAALSLLVAMILGFAVSMWVTQQVGRLTLYADGVRNGQRLAFPKLARTELQKMGVAFERMRETLAGHAYVAKYVEALTHEIKSPISAIRGAAEILESADLPPNKHAHFVTNIQNETRRIQDLVDRMLKLTELEAQRVLPVRNQVAVAPLVRTIIEAIEPALQRKQIEAKVDVSDAVVVPGDPFLIHLAMSNLIQNAIDFGPAGSCLQIVAGGSEHSLEIQVNDEGPGIPDFAKERIFEKFFSLERPDTGKKSTGLGLNFVREVAALHGGTIVLENREGRGLSARLSLPRTVA